MKAPGPFKSVERFRLFDEAPYEDEAFIARDAPEAPGGFLVFPSDQRLVVAHMAPARLLWQIEREQCPAPERQPRPIRTWEGSWAVDLEGQRIIEACERGGDAVVESRDLMTGSLRWSVHVPSPPPAWPKRDRGREVIDAIVTLTPAGVALLLNRTSERAELDERGYAKPAPSQVDVRVLDRATGAELQTFTLPDVHLDVVEQGAFSGLHRRGAAICDVNWVQGLSRVLAQTAGLPSRPQRVGGRVVAAWRRRGEVGVTSVGPDGDVMSRSMRRTGVKHVEVFDAADEPLLNINAQTILMCDMDLSARWEGRIRPYVYRACGAKQGPVFVGAAGGGGGLYAFDRGSGSVVLERRPAHEGCADATYLPEARWIVTSFNTTRRYGFGIAVVRPDGSEFQTLDVPCIVGAWKDRIATSVDDDGMISVLRLKSSSPTPSAGRRRRPRG